MSGNATGLTTRELVKIDLFPPDGGDGTYNKLIDSKIRQITDEIEQGINLKIIVRNYSGDDADVINGSELGPLILTHRPVVVFDELLDASDNVIDGDSYDVAHNSGLIVSVFSTLGASSTSLGWATGFRNYTAKYTAGFPVIPGGIEGIATDVVARRVRTIIAKAIGIQSETDEGGGTVTRESRKITKEEWKVLRAWGSRI